MSKEPRLTRFQRRFAQVVASGVKPTQALRDLKWIGTRPDVKASKLMALPHVREYIETLESDALRAAGVSRAMIARELARIAFADPRKVLNDEGGMKSLKDLDDDTAAVIAGLDVEEIFSGRGEEREHVGNVRKVKFWNKREALSELAVIAGMKREQIVAAAVGPGLTVIVQSGGQVNLQQNAQTNQVAVNLPVPA